MSHLRFPHDYPDISNGMGAGILSHGIVGPRLTDGRVLS